MMRRKNRYRPLPPTSTGELNMTPLIDVLLVLLVMILLTMPLTSHSLEVPLPSGDAPFKVTEQNTVTISGTDRVFWNGRAIGDGDLLNQLAATVELGERATVRFEPDANASYDRSAKTIALIKDAGIERFAFIGNERHRDFGAP